MDTTQYRRRIKAEGVTAVGASVGDSDTRRLTELYGAHNYHPLPETIVRAEGAPAYDTAVHLSTALARTQPSRMGICHPSSTGGEDSGEASTTGTARSL